MRRKFTLSIVLIFAVTLVWLGMAWAADQKDQTKDYESYDLGEVVVTADRPAVKEVAPLSVITAEDIAATNSRTVAEVLQYAPAIRVTSGQKNEPRVSLHGLTQSQILVLIDGVPFYETYYGALDLNQIPVDNIAKIEITEGAASVLYGPNGLGGVINIVTKKATDKPFTSFRAELSENSTYGLSATHGQKAGKFSYWLNYSRQHSNGWDLSDDFTPRQGSIRRMPGGTTTTVIQEKGERLNSDYESDNVWAKFGYEPNKNSEYYINLHYLNRERGNPPSLDRVQVFTTPPAFSQFWRYPKYESWGIDLNAKQRIMDNLAVRATLYYHNHIDDLASYSDLDYATRIALSRYKDNMLGGSLIFDYQPIKADTIRFAVNYRRDVHEDRDDEYLPFAKKSSYTGSIGVENEYRPIDNLAVVAGISYDWFDVREAQRPIIIGGVFQGFDSFDTPNTDSFNPMAGVTYTFAGNTKLYGSIARKTRFPTLYQLYTSRGGNPNLSAEKATNYIIGVKRPFSNIASAELVLFYYDIADMIVRSGPNNTDPLLNISNVTIQGVTVKAEVYPLSSLTVGGDFTWNDAEDRSDRRVTDRVVNVPVYKADAWVRYELPYRNLRTRFELTGLYVGRTYSQLPTLSSPTDPELKTSDYFIFDAKISQPFLKHFEVYAAAKNLTDKNYEPEVGYPAPGRSYWVGLSAKF